MAIRWEAKRPSEVRDYQVDWSDFLGDDTISSQTLTATGVTVQSSAIDDDDKGVTAWLSGGTAGTTAIITNTIITAGGRTERETITLPISEYDEPVSLTELKAHLRKTTDDEDALIASYGVAAREWCEDYTGHILVRRPVTQTFYEWGDYLTLYNQPASALVEIAYTDAAGEEAEYEDGALVSARYPARVYPAGTFPTLGTNPTITATYTAGYGDGEVPEKFRWAIKLLVTSMFENRGGIEEAAAQAVRFILRSYRGVVAA